MLDYTWTTTGKRKVLMDLLRLEIKRNTMIYFYCGKCNLGYVFTIDSEGNQHFRSY